MRLATCRYAGQTHAALVVEDGLALLPVGADDVAALLAREWDESTIAERAERTVSFDEVEFLPPVPLPQKIICVGLNYADHVSEAGRATGSYPSLFVRFPSSQVGHRQPVVAPRNSTRFDFEGELAVIIGRPARHVSEADAMSHVAGYTCFAENSVRDFQQHGRQATAGKNFLASGGFGPWVTTADEAGDPRQLTVITRLNGLEVQRAGVDQLIHPIEQLIAYISSFTRLVPGDVIATGTPSGVGLSRTPPLWMKPGDTLEVDIPGVGLLTHPVIAE